jgi:hypothetical protein
MRFTAESCMARARAWVGCVRVQWRVGCRVGGVRDVTSTGTRPLITSSTRRRIIYSGWPSCERAGALCALARDGGGYQCAQSHSVDSLIFQAWRQLELQKSSSTFVTRTVCAAHGVRPWRSPPSGSRPRRITILITSIGHACVADTEHA